jgi:hypothetical protein
LIIFIRGVTFALWMREVTILAVLLVKYCFVYKVVVADLA